MRIISSEKVDHGDGAGEAGGMTKDNPDASD
jgi:hypothetical protein